MSEYLGEDLIIATGAPGSGWSGVLRNLSVAREINKSDVAADKFYRGPGGNGFHHGTYFGPGEEFGCNFDKLDTLSKDEITAEFKRSYKNYDGIKMVKSHQFAYFLDFLYELFPKARYVLFYRDNDQLTFDWWHRCGGWGITHPNYDWYENDERMMKQIKLENAGVHKFVKDKSCYVFNEILDSMILFKLLNLTFTEQDIPNIHFPISGEVKKLTQTEQFYRFRFGTSMNADPFLYTAVL